MAKSKYPAVTPFEEVRLRRLNLGLTVTALANRMGVAKQVLSRIEHAEILFPDLKTAVACEDHLGIPVRAWLGGGK